MKKLLFIFAAAAMFSPVFSEEKKPVKPEPTGRTREWNRRVQHTIWRAFAELSDEERKAMNELQRNDPEKFREEMNKKAQEIFKAEKLERQQLTDLSKRYLNSKNAEEKEQIKQQTREILRKRFAKRLAANRRQLEAMKRRAARLEAELNKREANTARIIEFQTEAVLNGKPPFPPRGRRMMPPGQKTEKHIPLKKAQ